MAEITPPPSEETVPKEFDPSVIEKAERIRRIGHHPAVMRLVEPAVKMYWKMSDRHPNVWVLKEGLEKLPDGPYVAAFKHNDYDDIPASKFLLQGEDPKFLGKVDLWGNPVIGVAYTLLGGEPIVRPTDSEELANWDTVVRPRLMEYLASGGVVLGYPEGTRHPGPRVGKVKRGLTDLAYSAGVPIVPIGIANAHIKGSPVALAVGDPIMPTNVDDFRGKDLEERHTKAMFAMHAQLRSGLPVANDAAYALLARQTGQDQLALMAESQRLGDEKQAQRLLDGRER